MFHRKLRRFTTVSPSISPYMCERYYPGVASLVTAPVSVYDKPLAEDYELKRVSERLSTLLKQLEGAPPCLP